MDLIIHGKDYHKALFSYLTENKTIAKICMENYISTATLTRTVNRFYEGFPEEM